MYTLLIAVENYVIILNRFIKAQFKGIYIDI